MLEEYISSKKVIGWWLILLSNLKIVKPDNTLKIRIKNMEKIWKKYGGKWRKYEKEITIN